tara:strand:- start:116 stop:466 length:351 start_codon:yes stop_codon:yes gene_type:complete
MGISLEKSDRRTLRQRCGMIIERIVEHDILICISSVVSYSFNEEAKEQITMNEYETLDEDDEVFEYWIVTNWMARKLINHNECVTEIDNINVWSRTCTGQSIALDGVILEIASTLL